MRETILGCLWVGNAFDARDLKAADKTRKPGRRGQKIGGETPIFRKLDPVLSVALKAALDRRIEAIIDLAIEEPPVALTRELIYCRFPLVDGQGNSPALIEAAIGMGVHFVRARVPTLICCGGGMSRSPAIAAAVVARIDDISPEEAMKQVAATGPHDVAPLFWSEVVDVLRGRRD